MNKKSDWSSSATTLLRVVDPSQGLAVPLAKVPVMARGTNGYFWRVLVSVHPLAHGPPLAGNGTPFVYLRLASGYFIGKPWMAPTGRKMS